MQISSKISYRFRSIFAHSRHITIQSLTLIFDICAQQHRVCDVCFKTGECYKTITNFQIFGTFFYMRPETDRITVRMEISGHSNFNHHKEGGNGKIVGNLPLDLFQQNCWKPVSCHIPSKIAVQITKDYFYLYAIVSKEVQYKGAYYWRSGLPSRVRKRHTRTWKLERNTFLMLLFYKQNNM